MDERFGAAGYAVVLALLMVLGQGPLDEGWRDSELEDENRTNLETITNPPIMNNMSDLVEDGLAQFSGNVWVEPDDDGGYTVLNLGDPIWFGGFPYLTPGITVVDHAENVGMGVGLGGVIDCTHRIQREQALNDFPDRV